VGLSGQQDDFEINGDLCASLSVDCRSLPLVLCPLCLCLPPQLRGEGGEGFLFDSTSAEQECGGCLLAVAVDRQKLICGTFFLQSGGLLSEKQLGAVLNMAVEQSAGLFAIVDDFHRIEKEKEEEELADVPPQRVGLLCNLSN
jgi:hypothetical protein